MVAKYERNGSGLCCNLSSTPVEKLEDYLPPTTFDDLGFWDIESGALLYDKVRRVFFFGPEKCTTYQHMTPYLVGDSHLSRIFSEK